MALNEAQKKRYAVLPERSRLEGHHEVVLENLKLKSETFQRELVVATLRQLAAAHGDKAPPHYKRLPLPSQPGRSLKTGHLPHRFFNESIGLC